MGLVYSKRLKYSYTYSISMRFETQHPDVLIAILDATKVIASGYDELYLIFGKDKLSIQQMNGGHTTMIVADLYNSFFDGYSPEGSEFICVDLSAMHKRLSKFKGFKRLLVRTIKDDSMIRIYGEKGKVKKTMNVPVVISDMDNKIDPPTPKYEFVARLKSANFNDYVTDCLLVDDNYTRIGKIDENLVIYAKSHDGEARNEINIAEDMQAIIVNDLKSVFVTEALQELTKAGVKLAPIVQISLKTDFVIQMKYELEHGFVNLFLAPVILPDGEEW